MIQIKKLKRPNKRSGNLLKPGEVSNQRTLGVKIVNVGKSDLYIDRVTPKKKK